MSYTEYSAPSVSEASETESELSPAPVPARPVSAPLEAQSMSMPLEAAVPEWRAVLTRQMRTISGGTGTWHSRLLHIADLMSQVDGLFLHGAPQAYLESAAAADCVALGGPGTQPDPARVRVAGLNHWFTAFYGQAGRILARIVLSELGRVGLRIRQVARLDPRQLQGAHRYFLRNLYPMLTPLAVDPGRPFPYIGGGSTNLLFELQSPEQQARRSPSVLFARVEIPPSRPILTPLTGGPTQRDSITGNLRAGEMPRGQGQTPRDLLWTADIVRYFAHELFPGMILRNGYLFRVLRAPACPHADAENDLRDDTWHGRKPRRPAGPPVVRLEVEASMSDGVMRWLADHLHTPAHGLVRIERAQEIFGLGGLLTCVQDGVGAGARGAQAFPLRQPGAELAVDARQPVYG